MPVSPAVRQEDIFIQVNSEITNKIMNTFSSYSNENTILSERLSGVFYFILDICTET